VRIELNKAHFPVTALGPGRRIGLWVQGCSIRCTGCASLDTWDGDPGRALEVGELMDWVASIDRDAVDGVTISGGEPFDQPEALAELLGELRAWSAAAPAPVDLLVFSGYGMRRLRTRHAETLALADAVIAGPYVASRPTRLVWRGSSNQELVPLTPLGDARYGAHVAAEPARPPMQATVDGDSIWYVGVPRAGDLDRLDALLGARGVRQEAVSWRA
jgi:anaerobic ribonucleoside-triphosphate reductase activating protein